MSVFITNRLCLQMKPKHTHVSTLPSSLHIHAAHSVREIMYENSNGQFIQLGSGAITWCRSTAVGNRCTRAFTIDLSILIT